MVELPENQAEKLNLFIAFAFFWLGRSFADFLAVLFDEFFSEIFRFAVCVLTGWSFHEV